MQFFALITIFICFMFQLPMMASVGFQEFYHGERDTLILLRESVNSTMNLHSNWTGPPCIDNKSNWIGITCLNSHVVHVVLEGIQMTGSLPPSFLEKITYLSKISFRHNSLYGPLPTLSNLNHLQEVLLSNNSLSGSIPLDYIELPNLVKLELQDNRLQGTIPPFNQTGLSVLNVSDNHLGGQIPETPVLLRFPSSSYEQNSELCGKPLGKLCPNVPSSPMTPPPSPPQIPSAPPKGKKMLKVWSIALIAVGGVLVPFALMLLFLCFYRRVNRKARKGEESASSEYVEKKAQSSVSRGDPERRVELEFFDKERPVFDLDDLLRASAELMGKGKVGSTYKVMLEMGSVITVKRLKDMNGLSKKEFVQQMQLLGNMKHENLVEIISFYYSKEEKLVVYEHIAGGSMFDLLHGNRGAGRLPLNWVTRLSIIKGIAKGLSYLHQSLPSHKVPHANLKSSNVLISYHQQEQIYHPKLTDFGFLPLLPSRKSSERLAVASSPEFSQAKKLTHKSDVYCFGIILLELITGRIPGQFSPAPIEETDGNLSEWVRRVVHKDWSTDILDLEIVTAKEGHNEMLKLTEIALECTDSSPEKRPKMSEVVRRIEEMKQEGGREDQEVLQTMHAV